MISTKSLFTVLLSVIAWSSLAQQLPPVIDMHVHAFPVKSSYGMPDHYGNRGPDNQKTHFDETYQWLRKHNVVKAVVSGNLEALRAWQQWDTDQRMIKGLYLNNPADKTMTPERFEGLISSGEIQVFGEIGPYYSGTKLSDPAWQPYLKLCEQYDIPVAVHTGGGDPGGTYSWSPRARMMLGDPYLIEDTLVKYPKLRIYMMHAGEDAHERALRLMAYYPQLYTDLGALLWVEPLTQRYAKDFLRNAKHAGYLDRVMFGSDQIFWPDAIDRSIRYLDTLDFLTEEEKRGILYNNAARFLKLKD